MKKLLITGFEPFGGENINPSWEAVLRMPSEIGEYELRKISVPVVFGEGAEKIIRAADEFCPNVILCIGQAGGRDAITPELVGINIRHAQLPANSGADPQDEPVGPGGPSAYFSTLPARRIAKAVNGAGIPSRVSYTAGAYVCNDVLYSLLHRYSDTPTRVGFIHVPYSLEQGKEPAMDINDITEALVVAVMNIDA